MCCVTFGCWNCLKSCWWKPKRSQTCQPVRHLSFPPSSFLYSRLDGAESHDDTFDFASFQTKLLKEKNKQTKITDLSKIASINCPALAWMLFVGAFCRIKDSSFKFKKNIQRLVNFWPVGNVTVSNVMTWHNMLWQKITGNVARWPGHRLTFRHCCFAAI